MALTDIDRTLLKNLLAHERGAWNDFIDRFLGLIYHVIHSTAYLRSVPLQPEEVEDMAAEIVLQLISNDYAILRHFRKESSLATYLTVISRRLCIHILQDRASRKESSQPMIDLPAPRSEITDLEQLEEVQKLLGRLPKRERQVVRMFYIEGRSYEEISAALNLKINSIGPMLARAKQKLREGSSA